MAVKRRRLTMAELDARARVFVTDYLSKTPLALPAGLSEENFKTTMDAIVRVMMVAWAGGYFFGKDGV